MCKVLQNLYPFTGNEASTHDHNPVYMYIPTCASLDWLPKPIPVLIMVQDAPSLIISLLGSVGHGVAWNWIIRSWERHRYIRSVSFM